MISSFELVTCYPLIEKLERDSLDSFQVYIRFENSTKFMIKYFDEIDSHGVIKEFNVEELLFTLSFKKKAITNSFFISIHSYDYGNCTVIVQNDHSLIRENFSKVTHSAFTWLEINLNNLY